MPAKDERLTKELRRSNLALYMLRRKIRTQTICEWTGLSRRKVDNIRVSHGHEFPEHKLTRPSGTPPKTLRDMLRSAAMRCEAAALGGLCRALGVIPAEPVPDARRYLPSVSRGENVCRLHDAFCNVLPCAEITAEHLIWLSLALADAENFDVAPCTSCGAALIVDLLDPRAWPCINCSSELWQKAITEKRKPRARRRRGR